MAIKKYIATADNTIVNAYKTNLTKRATGSNAGASDVIETFSIYGRQSSSSAELSRILIKFPVAQITADRASGKIPSSGSVKFYLKLYNAANSKTVPSGTFSLVAEPVSKNWQEGFGLDLETYLDQTNGNIGSNWMSASDSVAWTNPGGDYVTAANAAYPYRWFSQTFYTGLEDFEIDITQMVELWNAETLDNYGLGIHFSGAYEAYSSSSNDSYSAGVLKNTTGSTTSYYTKRFFARGTQYFFKRPTLEARWDSTRKDDRGDIMYSSSLAGVNDNLNTLYLYNYVRGALTNIPAIATGAIYVSFYSGSDNNSEPSGQAASSSAATRAAIQLPTTLPHTHVSSVNPYVVTGGWVATGIYTASFALTSAAAPLTNVFDVWHNGAGKNNPWASVEYATASMSPTNLSASQTVAKPIYFMNITNLREKYVSNESARFNLFVRNKDWSPTIYTVANSTIESTTIHSASYRVFRVLDALEVVPYGTGSDAATALSHDVSGNYFDFDMSLLDPGYEYAFKISFYDSAMSSWSEQPELFKFRVIDNEY
tara:strand:- start:313 stop:1935 length:1623 start_codon:yes stop_codon:yes gene_type:complete